MELKKLLLTNFRNYSQQEFTPSANPHLIIGPNGAGKTNTLEAIYLLCTGKSFRLKKDLDLIQVASDNEQPKEWARLEAIFSTPDGNDHKRVLKLMTSEVSQTSAIKTLEIDGVRRVSAKHLLPVVIFEPDQLRIITDGPDLRRSYLDDQISRLNSVYIKNLTNYRRVLSQRNRLLKLIKKNQAQIEDLFIWHVKMSELAAPIIQTRQDYINALNKEIANNYQRISKTKDAITVEYLPNFKPAKKGVASDQISNQLFRQLEQDAAKDVLIGFTRTGPHRDDFVIYLNDKNSSTSASRGEVRSIVLALKFSEFQQIRDFHNDTPLVLLDDVMSELDSSRQAELLKFFKPAQVIVTGIE